jgi:hypothetical protein
MTTMPRRQGTMGSLFVNYSSSPNFGATFYHVKVSSTKNGLGFILGDFFRNASSHSVSYFSLNAFAAIPT